MSKNQKFFICRHCGNMVGLIRNAGVPMICCGEEMEELVPNTSEGAPEKHLPVVKQEGASITVSVGSASHPMQEDHHIAWIYLQTEDGGHRRSIPFGKEPSICFALTKDEIPVAVFAYCNLHGLWKTPL